MFGRNVRAIWLLAVAGWVAPTDAGEFVLEAEVDESQVVRPAAFQPPVFGTGSPGTGTSRLTLDSESGAFAFSLEVTGILADILDNTVGPNSTAMHVHVASPDARGPVLIDVHHLARQERPDSNGVEVTPDGFRVELTGTYSPQQGEFDAGFSLAEFVEFIRAGRIFVAVHTTSNSLFRTGAIRGNYRLVASPQVPFVRGDANGDGDVTAADAIFAVNYFFRGGPEPGCREGANSNGDAKLDVGDAVYVLNALFRGARSIPAPFPDCGESDGNRFDCIRSACGT